MGVVRRSAHYRRPLLSPLSAVVAAFIFMTGVGHAQEADAEPRIAVIKPIIQSKLKPQAKQRATRAQEDITSAMEAAMRSSGLRPQIREVTVGASKSETAAALQTVRDYNPAVVVTIGSGATRISKTAFPDTPVVFAMVLNPEQSKILKNSKQGEANITGAAIDIPLRLQFEKFMQVAPRVHRLGVISNPAHTGVVVQEAAQVAAMMGLTLQVESVTDASQVPGAVDRLMRANIDGLWMVADPTVLPSSELIITQCMTMGIPSMGLAPQHCEAGFLFALEVDYGENGRQAGELASRIVRGDNPEGLPVAVPHDVGLVLNQRIAEHMKFEFPASVVQNARAIYR